MNSSPASWSFRLPLYAASLTLFGWFEVFFRLLVLGEYTSYLHPRMGWLLAGGSILSLVFLAWLLWHMARYGSFHALRLSLPGCLILSLPLFYLFVEGTGALDSNALLHRLVRNDLWRGWEDVPSARIDTNAAPVDISLLTVWYDRDRIAGAPVACRGMVYRDTNMPARAFLLFRYVMSCCAADAQPVVLPVRWNRAEELSNDDWVRVEGALTEYGPEDRRMPLLDAVLVQPLPVPSREQRYLYPGRSR